jgi:hypothetical protein
VENEEALQAVNEKRNVVKGKSKSKVHPITGHEGAEVK